MKVNTFLTIFYVILAILGFKVVEFLCQPFTNSLTTYKTAVVCYFAALIVICTRAITKRLDILIGLKPDDEKETEADKK